MTQSEYEEKVERAREMVREITDMHIRLGLADRKGRLYLDDELYRTEKHGMIPVRRLTRKRRERIKRLKQQSWYKETYQQMLRTMMAEMDIRRECIKYEKELAEK